MYSEMQASVGENKKVTIKRVVKKKGKKVKKKKQPMSNLTATLSGSARGGLIESSEKGSR